MLKTSDLTNTANICRNTLYVCICINSAYLGMNLLKVLQKI